MATGQNYPGSKYFPEPAVFSGAVNLVSGSALKLAAGVPFSQAGSSVTPAAAAGTSQNFTTAGGQSGYVNPQGLIVLDSGVVSGSVLTTASTLATFTAEAQLAGFSIPAADPGAGAVYSLRLAGVFGCTGTPTFAFGLRYGGAAGTSIAAVPAITQGGALTSATWEAEAVLQFYSTTSAAGFIKLLLGTSSSTDAAAAFVASPTAAVTVASATAKVMSFTVTCSASSASNTITALTGYGQRLA